MLAVIPVELFLVVRDHAVQALSQDDGDESQVLRVVREVQEAGTGLTDSMVLRLNRRGGATAPEQKAPDRENEHRPKDSTQQAGRIIGVVPACFLAQVSGCKRA